LHVEPEYGSFYSRLPHDSLQTVLPWRSSVGCAWADKKQCTFCGLIPEQAKYERKPAAEAVGELHKLMQEHRILDVVSSDLLLSKGAIDDLCPLLADSQYDASLFFEVRATLSRPQLQKLVNSGVCRVQVGIESLDTTTLRTMEKGTTSLVNIRFLKWCLEYGIFASWIFIYGFANESADSLSKQAIFVQKVKHLQPPIAFTPVRIERGSPMERTPQSHGIAAIWPGEAMLHTYPLTMAQLGGFSIYFDHQYTDGRDIKKDSAALSNAVKAWREQWDLDMLFYRVGPGFIKVCDLRDKECVTTLTDWHAKTFLELDSIRSEEALYRAVASKHPSVSRAQVNGYLLRLEELGLVVSDGGLWLSVVPRYQQRIHGFRLLERRALARFNSRVEVK
jgi:ribosomal peptide maturation radical SAM protein 1